MVHTTEDTSGDTSPDGNRGRAKSLAPSNEVTKAPKDSAKASSLASINPSIAYLLNEGPAPVTTSPVDKSIATAPTISGPAPVTTSPVDNSTATAPTISEAPSTIATQVLGAQPETIALRKIASGPIDESQRVTPVATMLPGDSTGPPSINESPPTQALLSFHSAVPLSDVPIPSVEQERPLVAPTTIKAKTRDVDLRMSDAEHRSQPNTTKAVPNTQFPDVDVQTLDAEPTTPEPEIFGPTPLGSPANSVPDASCRNRRTIYTSSGSVALEPAPQFPKFPDGDVLIVSSTGRCWKLHSATLKNASTVLRDLLDGREALRSIKRHKQDARSFRWKIHMVAWEEKPKETRLRTFKMVDVTAKQPLHLPETMNGEGYKDPPYNKIYDRLFRCFYSLDPRFAAPVDNKIDNFIVDATSLLKAAEYLGAGPAVRLIVEANFLRLNQLLWKHVARNSVAWTDISLRLQSPTIFRAAMAHVVGRFDLRDRDGVDKEFLRNQPNGALLMEFAAKKAAELKDRKLWIERMLTEYYPIKMHHPEKPAPKIPGCDTYGNDIYLWQALTLVRQYFTSAMLSNLHHRANDGGAYFYHCIGQGGDCYLNNDVLERFHENFAMSTKGKECLRMAVAFMKKSMQKIVEPLLEDQSQISRRPDDPKPRYLTCSEIEDDELPWLAGRINYDDAD